MEKVDNTGFPVYALKDILPFRDFNCWQLLVKPCSRSIKIEEVHQADTLLIELLSTFEQLHSKEFFNINLHLHTHLQSCIFDYGPVYSFCLFAFERLNGILGTLKTNSHDISVQLMRRFLYSNDSSVNCWPAEFRRDFVAMVEKPSYTKGSLAHLSLPSLLGQSTHTLQQIIEP